MPALLFMDCWIGGVLQGFSKEIEFLLPAQLFGITEAVLKTIWESVCSPFNSFWRTLSYKWHIAGSSEPHALNHKGTCRFAVLRQG